MGEPAEARCAPHMLAQVCPLPPHSTGRPKLLDLPNCCLSEFKWVPASLGYFLLQQVPAPPPHAQHRRPRRCFPEV